MIVPIIAFSAFFTLMFFIIKSANKNREKQYETLIESLKPETELYIEQTKSSTMTSGLKNRDFLFNRCDLYLTKNAIVILGFTKDSFLKQLSLPIILTKELNEFSNRFPFAYVKKINKLKRMFLYEIESPGPKSSPLKHKFYFVWECVGCFHWTSSI